MCRSSRRFYLAALCLLLTAAGQTAAAQQGGPLSPPGDTRPDAVHGRLGDWFAVRDLEGRVLRLPDLHGRVLFVNFWATWCGPCIEEMPSIEALAGTLGEADVAFLLISIDEEARDVRRFVKRHALSLPVYFQGWAPGESTFQAGLIPATFIVSRAGEIRYQHHGAADWNTEAVRGLLTELTQR